MAKTYGHEFPERPLMAVISDLLGIAHFTTSRGSTVRADFLAATLTALDGDATGLNKDELLAACVAVATGAEFDRSLLSPGGTVTNAALQVIVDGITEKGVRGRLAGRPLAEAAPFELTDFDPDDVRDERNRQLAERAAREGQNRFRTNVLNAYGGRCALSRSDAVPALEAAHITPYLGARTDVISNGICLRADLHRLWDRGQIALQEDTKQILISGAMRATTYADLAGQRASLPSGENSPSWAALRAHRMWCGL
ncbi:HNH endonuclease [Nocardioides baculatus]|uniref:HNH endonuclease n=1 Tax=Nocardioides baculatus TaxID=2801337 RepID=A0ABS1LC41_9ACTN|nr:HNH endonuclease [Nocardioides baculatus]MBL0749249.1 HNH endonuclease [Nocardioides baculatus]